MPGQEPAAAEPREVPAQAPGPENGPRKLILPVHRQKPLTIQKTQPLAQRHHGILPVIRAGRKLPQEFFAEVTIANLTLLLK